MERNRDELKKALEGCTRSGCSDNETKDCPLKPYEDCTTRLATNALALITSQEQRIGELTEKSKNFEQAYDCMHSACLELSDKCDRLTEENEKLLTALANYDRQTDVRIAEEYYTAEAYEELREENERLRGERAKFFEYKHGTLVRNALVLTKNKKEFDDFCGAIKADTVRKMQERLNERFGTDSNRVFSNYNIHRYIDQITKEMLEGEK